MTHPPGSMGRSLVYLGAGFTFAAIVGGMAWFGFWLDGKCGTAPWLLIAGSMAGVGLAAYELLKTVQAAERKRSKEDRPQ